MKNLKDFFTSLFTMKTVWIDKGSGRWAMKKRFHPAVRYTIFILILLAGGVIYSSFSNLKGKSAEAVLTTLPAPQRTQRTLRTSTSTAPTVRTIAPALPPVEAPKESQAALNIAPPVELAEKTITRRPREIILPSEADPDTDQIIKTPNRRNSKNKYRVVISKSDFTLYLFEEDELIKTYPIAVGKNLGDKERVGDHKTPVGKFKVVSIENSSGWKHDFRDGKGVIAGAYGPWFLRLDAKGWKGIGIHGTHDPDSMGTNATEGCIRLNNEDIRELKTYAYKNMPVEIRE